MQSTERGFVVLQQIIIKGIKVHDIESVEIPSADVIKALRQKTGTQAKCAKMAQVSIVTWKQWESGLRTPSKPSWGMFLLAIDKHPDFLIVRRAVKKLIAELDTLTFNDEL